jgi:hypothetical protein
MVLNIWQSASQCDVYKDKRMLSSLWCLTSSQTSSSIRNVETVQYNNGCIYILHCCYDPCLYVSEVMWQWWAVCTAVKNINAPILTCVWQKLEYHIDMCRVTCGAHIEHL